MLDDQFVPLNRTFRIVSKDEIHSDNFDSRYDSNLWGDRNQTVWRDLEQRFRTVILAEGGAGKTREMRERCNTLRGEGKNAWFIELEMLANDSIEDLLELNNQLSDFTQWRESSDENAWIFLDAVDELKLKDGDFRKALFTLRKSIGSSYARIRIIISCRPSDWDKFDIHHFEDQLPAPKLSTHPSSSLLPEDASQSSEERFLAPLKGKPGLDSNANIEPSSNDKNESEKLEIFQFQNLTPTQVRTFVEIRTPEISNDFLNTIENDDRWAFTRQPQDLLELLTLWEENQSLGTYKEQLEAFLLSSLRERDRRPNESSQLSQEKAREGAERLALSLALSKKRTLLNVSDENPVGSTPSSVCPRELLQNWTSTEIKSLLRLRTFDPPSYGRIKFHRRDIQEYLAAGRLIKLAEAGNDSMNKLCALLFSKGTTGKEILLPSMKGIAVWVAYDSSEFGARARAKIINCEPQLLLANGDPAHLPISAKKDILNRVVNSHSADNRRTLSYSAASLKRFATPELAKTITDLTDAEHKSDSVTCLLLDLVKEGKIIECSEFLATVAMQATNPKHWRTLAVLGLITCNQDTYLSDIVTEILTQPQEWPVVLVADIIDELSPAYLSPEQVKIVLENLVQNTDNPLPDFSRPIQRLAEKLAHKPSETTKLKSALSTLILNNQLSNSHHYHPLSKWSELAPALQILCLNSDKNLANPEKKKHFFDCLTTATFWPNSYYGACKKENFTNYFSTREVERSVLFQWELEFTLKYFRSKPNKPLVIRNSLLIPYTNVDIPWLHNIVQSETTNIRIRLSALLERIRLWNANNSPQNEIEELRNLEGDNSIINEQLKNYLTPQIEPIDKEWERRKQEQKDKETKRLQGWLEWRQEILANLESSFSGEILDRNRYLMFQWLMTDSQSNGSYQIWRGGKGLAAAFSEETKKTVGKEFQKFWRTTSIATDSEQIDNQTSTPNSLIYALIGVSIESETPGWAKLLTDQDAQQAARIATCEINGLAEYIEQLIQDKPEPVKAALTKELAAQWNKRSEKLYLPLLQSLTHGNPALQSLLYDSAISLVLDWVNPSDLSDESSGWVSHHLSQLLRLVYSCWEECSKEQQNSLQAHCEKTLRVAPESIFSSHWLRFLFQINLQSGFTLLEEVINGHSSSKRKDAAIRLFANLFGDHFNELPLNSAGNTPNPRLLGSLVQLAYKYIIPTEDEKHPSGFCYTPNLRDDAQQARSTLVNQLIAINGGAADLELERLASSSECKSIEGYLRSKQRIRAENRADYPYSTTEIREIEDRFESAPKDRDSLFRVMMARLENLQDYIDTDDFVPLLTLQRIDSEEEMQRTIAMFLKQASNGIYEIFRETEVKERKRTDIHFCVPSSSAQAVIEIKVGEKEAWTARELLKALENQLVDQYLREPNRKAGCLLVTYGGHISKCSECDQGFRPRKKWKDPNSGKLVDFRGLIDLLKIRAQEIESEHNGEIRVGVFGLDLRNPSEEVINRPQSHNIYTTKEGRPSCSHLKTR